MRRIHMLGRLIAMIAVGGMLASPVLARHRQHQRSYENSNRSESSDQGAASVATTGEKNVAGKFDYYALVLSWSPSFCATHGDNPQCSLSNPRPYNFVLHGLWPQYQKGWPQNCPVEGRSFVPDPVINQMLDIMPAKKLVIHEYQRHGTCSGLDPEGYFALARKLYTSIQIPQRFQNPAEVQTVSPDDLLADFIKSNPDLKPDMIAVGCGGAGNRLQDVHICVSHQGKPTACGRNEVKRKMCQADSMTVPPVRAGSGATSVLPADIKPAGPPPAPKKTLSGAVRWFFGK